MKMARIRCYISKNNVQISGQQKLIIKKLKPCIYKGFSTKNGVPDRNRTCGVSLRRRTLYPAEVREHIKFTLQE